MEGLDHGNAALSNLVVHLDFTQELLGDGLKGIWWPFREPIDCRTVDNRWEISDSVSNGCTDRGERQNNMQVLLASFKEVSKELGWCTFRASLFLFGRSSYQLAHISFFISSENVWNLTGVQNVVDIFKERLLLNLSISE